MNSVLKHILIIGIGAIIVGALIAVGAFFSGANEYDVYFVPDEGVVVKDAKTEKLHINEEIEPFEKINIEASYFNIEIVSGDRYNVEIYENRSDTDRVESIRVENKVLYVNTNDTKTERNHYYHFNFPISELSFLGGSSDYTPDKITITVPENVDIKELTANINSGMTIIDIEKINKISLKLSYGALNIWNLTSHDIQLELTNSSVSTENVTTDSLKISNSYSHINLNDSKLESVDLDVNNCDIYLQGTSVNNFKSITKYSTIIANESDFHGFDLYGENTDVDFYGKLYGVTKIRAKYGEIDINTRVDESMYSYKISCENEIWVNDEYFEKDVEKEKADTQNSIDIESNWGTVKLLMD